MIPHDEDSRVREVCHRLHGSLPYVDDVALHERTVALGLPLTLLYVIGVLAVRRDEVGLTIVLSVDEPSDSSRGVGSRHECRFRVFLRNDLCSFDIDLFS